MVINRGNPSGDHAVKSDDAAATQKFFAVQDYDLDATLISGQAFRWERQEAGWVGVLGNRWVRLVRAEGGLIASTVESVKDWGWLRRYLQVETDLKSILATFPDDEPMRRSVAGCRGLRLLRQDPWECLASFILSSTKQIVQIQQIVSLLCERYGRSITVPTGEGKRFAFPTAAVIASLSEADLRACKMGFRAPYLRGTAELIVNGTVELEGLRSISRLQARQELMKFPGVGGKIADCVLLFAYGFDDAFPVDVWVARALQDLYFPKRRAKMARLLRFAATHFGPHAGYAQQYLFHYARVVRSKKLPD